MIVFVMIASICTGGDAGRGGRMAGSAGMDGGADCGAWQRRDMLWAAYLDAARNKEKNGCAPMCDRLLQRGHGRSIQNSKGTIVENRSADPGFERRGQRLPILCKKRRQWRARPGKMPGNGKQRSMHTGLQMPWMPGQ